MAITKVEVYKTSDGKLHGDEESAKYHEAKMEAERVLTNILTAALPSKTALDDAEITDIVSAFINQRNIVINALQKI